MILFDQPTIFPDSVTVAVSSKTDGSMKFGHSTPEEVLVSRQRFLAENAISIDDATLVPLTYENAEHFARYRVVDDAQKGRGMYPSDPQDPADALIVTKPGHALFLPLADCTGVVLYDQGQQILMLSHIGRHSAEIDGAKKSVEFLQKECGVNPQDLLVWLSPAVGKASYPLHKKDGKGLHEAIIEQLYAAGVMKNHIEASTVDTSTDDNYQSHSNFLKGKKDDEGRFAVVAMMRVQGEPAS